MRDWWLNTRAGILVDLWSMRVFLWLLTLGRSSEADLLDSHLYFWDRYSRLARVYRAKGRVGKARVCERRAQEHYDEGGLDGPPYAAALAMPRPRAPIVTNAVSTQHLDGPDDAA